MKCLRAFTAALVALAVAPVATAQQVPPACPERPAAEAEAKRAAKQWFSAGESMFAVGKYAEALESFQCSLQLFPHRVTVYNASKAALFGGDKRAALQLTERYLAMAPDGEKADEARKTLEELKAAIAAEPAPAPVEEPAPQEATPVEPEPAAEPAPMEPVQEDDGRKKRLGLAPLIATAAATVGLGVGTLVLDFKVGDRFDTADRTGASADRDSAESLQVVEQVFFGITMVGVAATGVLLFLTDFKKKESEGETATTAVIPLVLDRGAGLALTRGF
jgi:tetratricopeptide (TPR) repeat protein